MRAETEEQLTQKISELLQQNNIQGVQSWLTQIARNLQIEPLQAAAALLCLNTVDLGLRQQLLALTAPVAPTQELQKNERQKMVRYRLEVGRVHEISVDDLKNVLISESGVERTRIGHLEMRNHYTLVDLPNGMPPDIFQHLQSVEINQHPLKIKRISMSKKRQWQRHRRKGNQPNSATLSASE
jgi:DbpA RNA binding domain